MTIDPNAATTAMQPEDGLEVVAWRYCSHDINGDPWPWEYTDNEGAAIDRAARGFEVEHLIRHHEAAAIITSLRAENERLAGLADRLKLEAQGHASEARTANNTIYEIYQVLSGGKGEPGNWNGAEPARRYVEGATAIQARLDAAVEALKPFAEAGGAIEGAFGVALFPDDGVALGCTWTINGEKRSITWADFRKARATLSSLK